MSWFQHATASRKGEDSRWDTLWGEVEGKPGTEFRRWRRREPWADPGPEGFLEEAEAELSLEHQKGSGGERENGLSEGRARAEGQERRGRSKEISRWWNMCSRLTLESCFFVGHFA